MDRGSRPAEGGPGRHVPELDSLRGLAALAVLLEHISTAYEWPFPMGWTHWPLIGAAFDGAAAVAMFFVLSGFVLSRPYLIPASERPLRPATFYVRRVARVWLPWLAVFAVSLVFRELWFDGIPSTDPHPTKWLLGFWRVDPSLWDLLRQCLFMDEDVKFAPVQLLPQDWSLAVEMKASLLMPLMILLTRRNPWLLALGVAVLLVVFSTGYFYVSFGVGVLLAAYWDRLSRLAARLDRRVLLALAIGALAAYQSRLVFGRYRYVHLPIDQLTWIVTSGGAAAFIALAMVSRKAGRFLRSAPCLWLGERSFSVYLVQMLVLIWLVPRLVSLLNALGLRSGVPLFLVIAATSMAITFLLAAVVRNRVEKPAISLGKWLSDRLVVRRVGQPSAARA